MHFSRVLIAATLVAAPVAAVDKTSNPELVAKLKTAATQLDRLALLPNNEDWTYDFTKNEKWNTDKPGSVSGLLFSLFFLLVTLFKP